MDGDQSSALCYLKMLASRSLGPLFMLPSKAGKPGMVSTINIGAEDANEDLVAAFRLNEAAFFDVCEAMKTNILSAYTGMVKPIEENAKAGKKQMHLTLEPSAAATAVHKASALEELGTEPTDFYITTDGGVVKNIKMNRNNSGGVNLLSTHGSILSLRNSDPYSFTKATLKAYITKASAMTPSNQVHTINESNFLDNVLDFIQQLGTSTRLYDRAMARKTALEDVESIKQGEPVFLRIPVYDGKEETLQNFEEGFSKILQMCTMGQEVQFQLEIWLKYPPRLGDSQVWGTVLMKRQCIARPFHSGSGFFLNIKRATPEPGDLRVYIDSMMSRSVVLNDDGSPESTAPYPIANRNAFVQRIVNYIKRTSIYTQVSSGTIVASAYNFFNNLLD